MRHACHERDERTNVVTLEQVGTAVLDVFDVDIEIGVFDKYALRIDLSALATVLDLPLRVRLHAPAQQQTLCGGVIEFEFSVAILLVE